ncbi:MAG TPA: hypothetical protein VEO01_17935 [Pseudonocardiaceae bacterium]|nr:hypothetical protein [Pseudonocardiaceae bacterium]
MNGFWSYAKADNEYEGNRIVRLAELVRNEYSLITGQDLELFTDRSWPEDGHHDGAFFVPIITPRYFNQPECRQELLDFAARVRKQGAAQLMIPIVYTYTPALADPRTQDEAVALVRRMRYEKWHDLRTDDETSPAHRRAVSRLATRLAEISHPSPVRPLDVVGALEEAIPRWGKVFMSLDRAMATIDSLNEKLLQELPHTDSTNGIAVGRLTLLRTYADEMTKPAQDMLRLGNLFASEVIQLDPDILALIHNAETTEPEDFVGDGCSLILAITQRLQHDADMIRIYSKKTERIAELSEILDDPVNDVATGVQRLLDGTSLINEWETRIRATLQNP